MIQILRFSGYVLAEQTEIAYHARMQPEISLPVLPDRVLRAPADFAQFITKLSDEQVAVRASEYAIDSEEFRLGCDALNLARIAWRLHEDFGIDRFEDDLVQQIIEAICTLRGFEKGDFVLAVEATQERARHPFGARPLEEAFQKAQQRPLTLKHPKLSEGNLPAAIAGIALELQLQQGDKPIILPVDPLRRLFRQRKLVVGGALRQLVKYKLLAEVDGTYFRGKAREYRFAGCEGVDYERNDLKE